MNSNKYFSVLHSRGSSVKVGIIDHYNNNNNNINKRRVVIEFSIDFLKVAQKIIDFYFFKVALPPY